MQRGRRREGEGGRQSEAEGGRGRGRARDTTHPKIGLDRLGPSVLSLQVNAHGKKSRNKTNIYIPIVL